MRYLQIRLEQPEWMRHPMQEFLASSDALTREELLAWNLSRDDVQFALFYVEGDIEAYRTRIEAVGSVRRYDLAAVDDDEFYAFVCQEYTDSDTAFFRAFARSNVVVVPPLIYDTDGRPRVTVVGSGRELTALVDALDERADIGVDVLRLGTYDHRRGTATGGLTDRQIEALETAVRSGYYAVPRQASVSAVAENLGIAISTCSELLQRAEANLVKGTLGEEPPPESVPGGNGHSDRT